ncbi:MAG: type II secretion system F family protein [Armatimonadota bacterium]
MDQRRVDRAILALWCRELGTLLRLDVPVLSALEVVAQEIEPLAPVTVALETSVQAGDSLAQRVAELDGVFPPLLRAAVLAGEAHGCLADALVAVADCLQVGAELGVASTSRARLAELAEQAAPAPAVVLSRRLLNEAIEQGARRLRVTGGADGGLAEVEVGGTWQRLEEIDAENFGPLCRRIKLMAEIPYWIAEPAVGTIRLSTAERGEWNVAVQAIPDDDGIGQHIDMTLVPRERQ